MPTDWSAQIAADAAADKCTVIFDGRSPNKLACDTTLREMPDGSWVMVMLGGGDTEPDLANRVFLTRSTDAGATWSPLQQLDFHIPGKAFTLSELMIHQGRCTLFVSSHNGDFGGWRAWMTHSDDSCRTWSKSTAVPGRLAKRTFVRNHIVTRDGRVMLPFQHYCSLDDDATTLGDGRRVRFPRNPRNGVLISADNGQSWSQHGDIRISADSSYHGWAENNIVELADGRIAMIIRADKLGGILFQAESTDGGLTWPDRARRTHIPNPGSKATLYPLGGDTVAMLHNPNQQRRSPLSLWISFDGLQTWPYQRVLVAQPVDGPNGALNYPDGFVSADRTYLHFAFDDCRHRAVYIGAKLPPLP